MGVTYQTSFPFISRLHFVYTVLFPIVGTSLRWDIESWHVHNLQRQIIKLRKLQIHAKRY